MAAYCESCCREQQTCEGCRNLADKLRAAQRVLDELELPRGFEAEIQVEAQDEGGQ